MAAPCSHKLHLDKITPMELNSVSPRVKCHFAGVKYKDLVFAR